MDIAVLGVDLGKTICNLVGFDDFAAADRARGPSALPSGWLPHALSRWRPAVARITSTDIRGLRTRGPIDVAGVCRGCGDRGTERKDAEF